MNPSRHQPGNSRCGFTLIELLTVISIIGILAAMLLPALARAKVSAKVVICKTEMNNIVGAVNQYYAHYNRFPCSSFAVDSVSSPQVADACPDFTFGTVDATGRTLLDKRGLPFTPIRNVGNVGGARPGYQSYNAEIIAILRDNTNITVNGFYPNDNHSKNPDRLVLLNAKEVTDTRSPGIGVDGVFRDLFGNPYIITIDLNYDDRCRDSFYRLDTVSGIDAGAKGYNGLSRAKTTQVNVFEYPGSVMVWSFGPDGQANQNVKATQGVNKDNILSWK